MLRKERHMPHATCSRKSGHVILSGIQKKAPFTTGLFFVSCWGVGMLFRAYHFEAVAGTAQYQYGEAMRPMTWKWSATMRPIIRVV